MLGTAFFAIVLTPEWAAFLQAAKDKLAEWGVPMVVLAVIGVFISELWKQILNYRIISKAREESFSTGAFEDVTNQLY